MQIDRVCQTAGDLESDQLRALKKEYVAKCAQQGEFEQLYTELQDELTEILQENNDLHIETQRLAQESEASQQQLFSLQAQINDRDCQLLDKEELEEQLESLYTLKPMILKVAQLFDRKQIYLNDYSFELLLQFVYDRAK